MLPVELQVLGTSVGWMGGRLSFKGYTFKVRYDDDSVREISKSDIFRFSPAEGTKITEDIVEHYDFKHELITDPSVIRNLCAQGGEIDDMSMVNIFQQLESGVVAVTAMYKETLSKPVGRFVVNDETGAWSYVSDPEITLTRTFFVLIRDMYLERKYHMTIDVWGIANGIFGERWGTSPPFVRDGNTLNGCICRATYTIESRYPIFVEEFIIQYQPESPGYSGLSQVSWENCGVNGKRGYLYFIRDRAFTDTSLRTDYDYVEFSAAAMSTDDWLIYKGSGIHSWNPGQFDPCKIQPWYLNNTWNIPKAERESFSRVFGATNMYTAKSVSIINPETGPPGGITGNVNPYFISKYLEENRPVHGVYLSNKGKDLLSVDDGHYQDTNVEGTLLNGGCTYKLRKTDPIKGQANFFYTISDNNSPVYGSFDEWASAVNQMRLADIAEHGE